MGGFGPQPSGSGGAKRPHLRFPQIWNMSFGFLGIQFGWALQMANMSAIYEYLGAEADQIPILWLAAPLTGLVVMAHRLPGGRGIEVTALNFAKTKVDESVQIDAATAGANVTDMIEAKAIGKLAGKRLAIALGPHQGQVLLLK